MGKLPQNGDAVINECLNCELAFEEVGKLGEWLKCDRDNGGCGFEFMLRAKKAKLEKPDEE